MECTAVTAARDHLPGLLLGLVNLMGRQVAQGGGPIPDQCAGGCIGSKLLAWQLGQQLPLSTCTQHLVKVVCALGAGVCLLCHLQHHAGGLPTTDHVCLNHCMLVQSAVRHLIMVVYIQRWQGQWATLLSLLISVCLVDLRCIHAVSGCCCAMSEAQPCADLLDAQRLGSS